MDVKQEPYRLYQDGENIADCTDELFLYRRTVKDNQKTRNSYMIAKDVQPRRRSAETKHASATAFTLGNDYLIKKCPNQAFQSYLRAAVLGHAGAQYNLGLMCLKGEGVLQDAFAGLNWIELAADNGDKKAQDLLRRMD